MGGFAQKVVAAVRFGIVTRHRHDAAMPPRFIHSQLQPLIRPEQTECWQENVQQPGVIRVPEVFDYELPIRGNGLTGISLDPELTSTEHALVGMPEPLGEVRAERRGLVAEAGPNHAV